MSPWLCPRGLLKYRPAKFFSVFLVGKLLITVIGAFLGSWTKTTFSEWLSPEVAVVLSVALTVVITIILLKVDLGKSSVRFLQRGKTVKAAETLDWVSPFKVVSFDCFLTFWIRGFGCGCHLTVTSFYIANVALTLNSTIGIGNGLGAEKALDENGRPTYRFVPLFSLICAVQSLSKPQSSKPSCRIHFSSSAKDCLTLVFTGPYPPRSFH